MPATIDVRKLACPGPVIELRKLLDSGARQAVLHVADELARSNVTRFATSRGAQVDTQPHQGGFLVTGDVPTGTEATKPTATGDPAADRAHPSSPGPVVVQLSSAGMGSGEDELGALLQRGFIKTLAKVQPLPSMVLCYNGGVSLCCQGSASLDDLRALEAAGVTIVACGTCLNFFGLADQLAVGRVTDMLEIVSSLSHAGRVIRP